MCGIGHMAQDVRELVAMNVRRLREATGISQAALAADVGVDRAYISSIESGTRNATITSLARIANGLRVPVSELFVGTEP